MKTSSTENNCAEYTVPGPIPANPRNFSYRHDNELSRGRPGFKYHAPERKHLTMHELYKGSPEQWSRLTNCTAQIYTINTH